MVKNRQVAKSLSLLVSASLISVFAFAALSIIISDSADYNAYAGSFPGTNGKIAFTSDREGQLKIYVINADGTDEKRLIAQGGYQPDWSADGKKIAFASNRASPSGIFIMNSDGSGQTMLSGKETTDTGPSWSPDGTKIAFTSDHDVYVMNADGTGRMRLTTDPNSDFGPSWSPDGTKIAFTSQRDGLSAAYIMNSDGSGQKRVTDLGFWMPSWSPDGKKLVLVEGGENDIYVINADGTGLTRLTDAQGRDSHPRWSPDGTKIAFFSERDLVDVEGGTCHCNAEIYIMNADGTEQTRLTNRLSQEMYLSWGVGVPSSLPPDTQITKASDSFSDSIRNGGSTLSTSMTFTFTGFSNSSVSVNGFECKLDDALVFALCTSPITYTSLSYGSHTFYVRAIDATGAVDPTPSIWTWSVLTQAKGVQKLLNKINALEEVDSATKASLLAPLKGAKAILGDSNSNNDNAVCGKLHAFLNKVEEKERHADLTTDQSAKLRKLASQIRTTIGCS